jgi:hydroxymethylglutaryl-CoA reductase (NADPH)
MEMSFDELVEKVANGEIKLHQVEKYTDGDKKLATEIRRKALEKKFGISLENIGHYSICLLYTSPSPRDGLLSRMPSSA